MLKANIFNHYFPQAGNRPSLVSGDCRLTRKEVSNLINGWSSMLRIRDIGPGSKVAVISKNSAVYIPVILSIWNVGAAFAPMDIRLPLSVITKMIDKVTPDAVFIQDEANCDTGAYIQKIACLTTLLNNDRIFFFSDRLYKSLLETVGSTIEQPYRYNSNKIRYIIHTSGSTGIPKGVKIPYSAYDHYLRFVNESYRIGPHHNLLNLLSFAFDGFLHNLAIYLNFGCSMIIPPNADFVYSFFKAFKADPVHILSAVPSTMELLLKHRQHLVREFASMKYLFVGGDAVKNSFIKQIAETFPGCNNYILYGPTEATITCAAHKIEGDRDLPDDNRFTIIGKVIPGNDLYILGSDDHLCGENELGEICIAGIQLMTGYLGEQEMTDRVMCRIVIDGEEKILYRTGDLGYHRKQIIYFFGRRDSQMKRAGYRIDIAGLESLLSLHEKIKDFSVEVIKAEGQIRIDIWVTVHDGTTENELWQYIKAQAPWYLCPDNIHFTDPLTLRRIKSVTFQKVLVG